MLFCRHCRHKATNLKLSRLIVRGSSLELGANRDQAAGWSSCTVESRLSTLDTAIITLVPAADEGRPWSCFRCLLSASPTHLALRSLSFRTSLTRNRLFPLAFLPLSASGQPRNHATSLNLPSLFPPSQTLRPHHAHTCSSTHLSLPTPTSQFPSPAREIRLLFSFSPAGPFAASHLLLAASTRLAFRLRARLCTLRHARTAGKVSETWAVTTTGSSSPNHSRFSRRLARRPRLLLLRKRDCYGGQNCGIDPRE